MEQISNKDKQRRRMMSYFIQAAIEIIEKESMNGLSIRKVADLAGYNSATLYHYFSNLEELTFFASISCLNEYAAELPSYLAKSSQTLDRYLSVWECFCKHSYCHPDTYRLLFFSPRGCTDFKDVFKTYYEIFPDKISEEIREYELMLTEGDLYKREYFALTKALKKEQYHLSEEDVKSINEMNILLYRGMLAKISETPDSITIEQAVQKTICYMKHTLSSYLQV